MTFTRIFRFLQLDQREFHFQFQSHPDYPSALAFSDTLNFLDVKNDAYELEKEFWDELPEEFITIYKGNFSLVKKYKTAYLVLSDIEEKISKTQLQEHTDNFVMLFEKAEEKQEKSKLNFSYFVYAFFCLVLLYSVIFQNWEAVVFNGFSILGLYISLEIFNKKFGKESVVLNNFCGSSAKNSKPENCTKIIDYDKINILGLKLSDCSLVYFSALLVLGLFFPATMGVLKILALSSVLVIGYSLYIQIFVEKTFCKICLLIIAILAGQIIISLLFYGNEISVKVLFSSLFAFLISFFSLVFINILMEQKE